MKTGRPKLHGEKLLSNGLTPTLWAWVKEEATRQGINRTELLRLIVADYKKNKEAESGILEQV